MAVHDRWRRHRGGRDEGGTGDSLTPSARTRSVLPDPGGRTEVAVGLNSRPIEWSRPPEPHPPDAGCWCSRTAATVCEFELVQHAIRSGKRAQTLDSKQRPENQP